MKLLVIGIGQSLRSDDGSGIAAVQHWQNRHPDTAAEGAISVELVELPGIGLLNLLAGYDAAILVDAVQSQAAPGTIHQLSESDLAAFGKDSQSAHGWGVAETLQLGRKLGLDLPAALQVIGIEVENISPGDQLSSAVQEALDQAALIIDESVKMIRKVMADEWPDQEDK